MTHDEIRKAAREAAQAISDDARRRLLADKPAYDTIDLGEKMILRLVREAGGPDVSPTP